MRCLMCEEPEIMYIPSDDIPDVGLYSCGACGFELEGPLERPSRPLTAPARRPLPLPLAEFRAPAIALARSTA